MAAALDLSSRPAGDVVGVLTGERLLRHPVRLAAEQLLRRVASDWQLAVLVERPPGVGHALLGEWEEMLQLWALADAPLGKLLGTPWFKPWNRAELERLAAPM